MKPTIGRIVHYRSGENIYAALIVWVRSDTCVDLVVWKHDGTQRTLMSVDKSIDLNGCEECRWQWPPRV